MHRLIKFVENSLLNKHLERQATSLEMGFLDPSSEDFEEAPQIIVAELEHSQAINRIIDWKRRWPECYVALSVSELDRERWIAAESAGADLVANRGALPRLLRDKMKLLQQGDSLTKQKLRLKAKPVVNSGDGLVGRLPDSPEDPIAVFRMGNQLCAVRDVCPHAGFSLADGEFDPVSGSITCPEHGSRFQVCTGERLRGPADYPLRIYPALSEQEEIWVEIEQEA